MQKAQYHPNKSWDLISLLANGFRYYFTPLTGVLLTFPSRYLFTIGQFEYLALARGRAGFPQDFTCPAVLRNPT